MLILSAAKRLRALDAGLARETYVEALEAAILLGQRDAVVEVARGAPCGMAVAAAACRRAPDDGWAQLIIEGYPAGTDLVTPLV